MHTSTRVLRHLAVAVCFAVFALLWTYPLPFRLFSAIPGDLGDNVDFLWNTWWMREAVRSPAIDFFRTTRLFAPFGADLTLHTHTAFPSWIAAVVFDRLPIVAAHNLVILLLVAANGFAAYLLAWSRLRDHGAALLAGLIFGGAPFLAGHLMGHVNLIAAWTLPLFLLFYLRAVDSSLSSSPTGARAAFVGAALCVAVTAYTDYYYLVYELVLAAGLWLTAIRPVDFHLLPKPAPKALLTAVAILLLIDLTTAFAIVVSGGFVGDIAGIHIAATRPTNVLAFGWLLLLIAFLARFRPVVAIGWPDRRRGRELIRAVWPAVLALAIGIVPLAILGTRLVLRGDYISAARSWRSGAPGVDLATLALGNPWHPITGPWTRALYQQLGIDKVEGSAWLGVAPLALLIAAVVRRQPQDEIRLWKRIGIVFFVWSLGPWLKVAGRDTGLLLPQNFFQFVPLLSNVRIPGRALVIVLLAVAMLAALAITRLPSRLKAAAVALSIAFTVVDYLPAPFPMTTLDVPPIYGRLRDLEDGNLLELPVGLRDGFNTIGRFDDRVALYQLTHGRPIAGGFLARLPPSLALAYDNTPVLRSLLSLSGGGSVDRRDQDLSREEIAAALRSSGMRFVMLNRETAPAALTAFVESRVPVRVITREGPRDLYEVQ